MNLGIFKKALPFLASAIPGGGVVSKMAFAAIGKALGTDPPKDVDAATAALAGATPEQLLALQTEEHNFKLQLETLNIKTVEELARLTVADRDSARQREIAVKDRMPGILGIGTTVGFFALIILLAYHSVPEQMKDVLLVLIGALAVGWKDVMGYYFGSSAGSARKQQLIEKMSTE